MALPDPSQRDSPALASTGYGRACTRITFTKAVSEPPFSQKGTSARYGRAGPELVSLVLVSEQHTRQELHLSPVKRSIP